MISGPFRDDYTFFGLSTDTKPGADAGIKSGARFVETDTGSQYVFVGGSWVACASSSLLGINAASGAYLPLEIDPINWALHVIQGEHHEIHEGYSFTAYYARTTAATNAHRSAIYIKTPASSTNTKKIHMVASFSCSAAADASICEAPTIAANVGTHANAILNRHRDYQSSKASGCFDNATSPAAAKFTTLDETQIAADVTFATGTILRTEPLQTGVGPKPAGGVSRGTEEFILKTNTAYIFLLTNTAASANNHLIQLDWYEHKTLAH